MTRFLSSLRDEAGRVLSFLSGETCIACGMEAGFICPSCTDSLPKLEAPFCRICAVPLQGVNGDPVCGECLADPPVFRKALVPFIYEGVLRKAVTDAKFNNKFHYLMRLMTLAQTRIEKLLQETGGAEGIIPVPMTRSRLYTRGYNQTAILSDQLKQFTGVPQIRDMLIKVKDTPPLSSLSRHDRAKVIKGSFSIEKKNKIGKIILVDDIITTTATIREASKVLRKGGIDEIYVFALCRTPQ